MGVLLMEIKGGLGYKKEEKKYKIEENDRKRKNKAKRSKFSLVAFYFEQVLHLVP